MTCEVTYHTSTVPVPERPRRPSRGRTAPPGLNDHRRRRRRRKR